MSKLISTTFVGICTTILCIKPTPDYISEDSSPGLSFSHGRSDSEEIGSATKMIRFIYGMDFRGHVDGKHLRDLSWLSISDRVKFFRMSHLFRIRHNLAPTYLLPNFRAISTVHSHNTRGSNHNFQLSRELSLSPSSFAFTAIKQWNGLPNNLKDIHEFRVFKQKQFLIAQYD